MTSVMKRVSPTDSEGLSEEFLREVRLLVAKYRVQCLWFQDEHGYPSTPNEIQRTLRRIESRADRSGFIKARRLREWLLRDSRKISAG